MNNIHTLIAFVGLTIFFLAYIVKAIKKIQHLGLIIFLVAGFLHFASLEEVDRRVIGCLIASVGIVAGTCKFLKSFK